MYVKYVGLCCRVVASKKTDMESNIMPCSKEIFMQFMEHFCLKKSLFGRCVGIGIVYLFHATFSFSFLLN